MIIQPNSSNIMSWCEGPYGNYSVKEMLEQFSGDTFDIMRGEEDIAKLSAYVNNPDNFANDQLQLLCIVSLYMMTTRTFVIQHKGWSKLAELSEFTFFVVKAMEEQDPELLRGNIDQAVKDDEHIDLSVPTPDEIPLRFDRKYFDEMPSPEMITYVTIAISEIMLNQENHQAFELFADMSHRYARSTKDLVYIAIAVGVARIVVFDKATAMVIKES